MTDFDIVFVKFCCVLVGCTPEQANAIIEFRPFLSIDDLNSKLGQGKKKAGPAGISPRMFEDCGQIFEGYGKVDAILEDCERIGAALRIAITAWTSDAGEGREKQGSSSSALDGEDGALCLQSLTPSKDRKSRDYLVTQPSLLANNVQLKDYQLLGVNWLHLLYRRSLSCILADEMGMSFPNCS
jgi:SWI/SNF-related matrix-associated actin-dependent regulator 1 of chromatin subfamily A